MRLELTLEFFLLMVGTIVPLSTAEQLKRAVRRSVSPLNAIKRRFN